MYVNAVAFLSVTLKYLEPGPTKNRARQSPETGTSFLRRLYGGPLWRMVCQKNVNLVARAGCSPNLLFSGLKVLAAIITGTSEAELLSESCPCIENHKGKQQYRVRSSCVVPGDFSSRVTVYIVCVSIAVLTAGTLRAMRETGDWGLYATEGFVWFGYCSEWNSCSKYL